MGMVYGIGFSPQYLKLQSWKGVDIFHKARNFTVFINKPNVEYIVD